MSFERIQVKRGDAARWVTNDPVLADGEFGWEKDTKKLKVGDGVTLYSALPYFGGGGGVSDGDKGDIVVSGSGASWAFDSGVVTTFARTFLDDADAATVRATLGIPTISFGPTAPGSPAVGDIWVETP